MARSLKRGVGYFPFDCDFFTDEKTRIIKGQFGLKGISTVLALLCEIYGGEGYYKEFGELQEMLLAESLGSEMSPGSVHELLIGCIRCGFFEKSVFDAFGILTSAGIQRRYLRAAAKRDQIAIIQEYWLLDIDDDDDVPASIRPLVVFRKISGTGKGFSVTGNEEKNNGNAQRKGKKRKEQCSAFALLADGNAELEQALADFAEMRREMKKPLTDVSEKRLAEKLDRLCAEAGAQDRARYMTACLLQSIENSWQGVFAARDWEEDAQAPVRRMREEAETARGDFSDLETVF